MLVIEEVVFAACFLGVVWLMERNGRRAGGRRRRRVFAHRSHAIRCNDSDV